MVTLYTREMKKITVVRIKIKPFFKRRKILLNCVPALFRHCCRSGRGRYVDQVTGGDRGCCCGVAVGSGIHGSCLAIAEMGDWWERSVLLWHLLLYGEVHLLADMRCVDNVLDCPATLTCAAMPILPDSAESG